MSQAHGVHVVIPAAWQKTDVKIPDWLRDAYTTAVVKAAEVGYPNCLEHVNQLDSEYEIATRLFR